MTSSPTPTTAVAGRNRVPEPDGSFWVLKIVTTGLGETGSDLLVRTFAPEAVVPIVLAALVAALVVQFRTRGYRPATYWTTALLVSVFGTMAADVLHVGLGVPYVVSTIGFAVVLAAIFVTWWLAERDLSVHDVTTPRREGFYWATVMATFALGTALGDWTASSLGLGYLGSAVLFLVVFAVPGVVHALSHRAAVVTFWAAYVMTRPLGASFADWFADPHDRGGVGLGPGPVSGVLLLVFVLLVLARTRSAALTARSAAPGA